MTLDRLISIDAETNGLAGRAFAVALTLTDQRGEIDYAVYRCPIDQPVDTWVAHNVLPAIGDIAVTCPDYDGLLSSVRDQYTQWMEPGTIVAGHVTWPVEARLLLDLLPGQQVWTGPYPLIDVSSVLLAHGHNPLSVDEYNAAHGILAPPGSPHHPLYDARAAERCLRHLLAAGPERRQLIARMTRDSINLGLYDIPAAEYPPKETP